MARISRRTRHFDACVLRCLRNTCLCASAVAIERHGVESWSSSGCETGLCSVSRTKTVGRVRADIICGLCRQARKVFAEWRSCARIGCTYLVLRYAATTNSRTCYRTDYKAVTANRTTACAKRRNTACATYRCRRRRHTTIRSRSHRRSGSTRYCCIELDTINCS